MEDLEEKVASALTNPSSMGSDELYGLLTDLERIYESGLICEDPVVLKKVLTAFGELLSTARPAIDTTQTQQHSKTHLFSKCLTCLLQIISNSDVDEYFREETSIMESLTSALNAHHDLSNQKLILRIIEVLSRHLKILTSPPYLRNLMKLILQELAVWPQSPEEKEIFLYCLRIMTNLVSKSGSCALIIAASDKNYQGVMKLLVTIMANETAEPELLVQMTRFCHLMEPSVDGVTTLFIQHVKSAFSEILKKLEVATDHSDHCNLNEYFHSIASSIYYMNQCVDTILNWIRKEYDYEFVLEEEPLSPTDGPSLGLCLVNNFVKDVAERLLPDLLKKVPLFQTEKPQLIIESLLGLVKATFPHCIPVSVYDKDVLESLIRCIDTLASVTKPKSKSHLIVLQTYNHFFDRLLNANIRTVSDKVFHNAFKSCQIVAASTSKDLIRNVETIRLLTHLTCNMGVFNDLIKIHLDQDLLFKLVECLLAYKPELFKPQSLLSSECFVETLSLISTISKCPTVLMEVFRREETLVHISNCIVNGDEKLISKGLCLTVAVGFTEKCRNDLTKIMSAMRECPLRPGSSSAKNDFLFRQSTKAQFGAKQLNNNLETLIDSYDENEHEIDNIGNVLSMHQMACDLHENEMYTLRNQICQLGRYIEELKTVFSKQNELINIGDARVAAIHEEHRNLKLKLNSMMRQKTELEIKHAKTIDALKKQRQYQDSLMMVKCEIELKQEKKVTQLKNEKRDLEASISEWSKTFNDVSAERATLKKQADDKEVESKNNNERISSLEKDLAKSKELLRSKENLLEGEQRKTEIIKQVLDKRQ